MSNYKGHIAGGTVAGIVYAGVITTYVEVANAGISLDLVVLGSFQRYLLC